MALVSRAFILVVLIAVDRFELVQASSDTNACPAGLSRGKWEFETGGEVRSSPALSSDDKTVFVGRDGFEWINTTMTGKFYAFNVADGTTKWVFETGNGVYSSPALSSDDKIVFVGSRDDSLYAINVADGTKKWEFVTGFHVDSSPALSSDDKIVFVGSMDNKLYAINVADGTKKWEFDTGQSLWVLSSPVLSSDDKTVFVGSLGFRLYAINVADGTLKWEFRTGNAVRSSPVLSSDDKTVFVGSYDNKLYAINVADGTLKWEFVTGNAVESSPALSSDDKTVFVGSNDNNLYAINAADGTKKWEFVTGGDVYSSPALSSDDKTVFVGSYDKKLYAINVADGTKKWDFVTGGDVWSSPVLSSDDKTVFVGSDDNKLYALSTGDECGNLVVVMMFPVDWPESVKTFERMISGINLDFVQIASSACLGIPVSFYGRFLSMIVITVAVIGIPWLVSWCRDRRDAEKWASAIKLRLRDTFLLVVLLHPTVSGQSFFHFRCRLVDDKWYLMADYSLECYDAAWYGMLAPVLLTILGFALGMPLLFARLLWVRRTELQKPETKKLLGVLYMSHKPKLYWFESVTMLFKLALWATLVFFEHGSQFQLIMSAVICSIQLGFHAHFEPFEHGFKNVLQYLSFILVSFAAFSGLALNYVKVSLELAEERLRDAEAAKLRAKERDFKTCTAFVIWGGATLILLQLLLSAFRFARKHGAVIWRRIARFSLRRPELSAAAAAGPAVGGNDIEGDEVPSIRGNVIEQDVELPEVRAASIVASGAASGAAGDKVKDDGERVWGPVNPMCE
eukprot:g4197.t1